MKIADRAVPTEPVDTEMSRRFAIPKSSPESVASGMLEGVERSAQDAFPHAMSGSMAESRRGGAARALERRNAVLVAGSASS